MGTTRVLSPELRSKYTRIAYYYYKADMTQQEIAQRLGMSRQQINRILDDCLKLGIVKISVEQLDEFVELETAMERKYGLKAVRIVRSDSFSGIHEALGVKAGEYLHDLIKSGDTIGFVPGRAISYLVDTIPPTWKQNLTVTQLIGSESSDEPLSGVDSIIHRFSMRLSAIPNSLYAPVMVSSREMRDSIVNEPYFKAAYEKLKNCSIAVVGIGNSSDRRAYLENECLSENTPPDAVGEICTHYYNSSGEYVKMPFSDRVIAIAPEDYMNIPTRIGVAGGREKAQAIRGAISGGYITVLVTDLEAAMELADT